MKTLFVAFALSSLMWLSACGAPAPGPKTCASCTGCCTDEGECSSGTANGACGAGGVSCVSCENGNVCEATGVGGGSCRAPCNAFNCSGCCVGGVCKAGTSNAECGQNADICVPCTGSAACDPTGTGGGICR